MAFVGTFVPSIAPPCSLQTSSFIPRCTVKPTPSIAPSPCSSSRSTRMLFGFNFFSAADAVALPQYDSKNAASRAQEVTEGMETYQWTRELIGDSPMIEGLPREEFPSIAWVEGLATTIFRLVSNDLAIRYGDSKEDLFVAKRSALSKVAGFVSRAAMIIVGGKFNSTIAKGLIQEVEDLLESDVVGKGSCFQEYKDLYKVFKPDTVAQLDQFLRDDIFGWYRVAGPNPMHMRKLPVPYSKMFPELNNDIFRGIRGFSSDSLEAAERENRLFFVDYKDFDGVKAGKFPDGTLKEGYHIYAPTALLAIPKNPDPRTTVLPIAIRCGQDSSFPMYTPNSTHTDEVTWIAAKTTVQVADAVMHEVRYHLGRCHLLLEVFVCSMNRKLAENHPLRKFLSIHFTGTAVINYLGSLRLAAPGGTIDVITAPPIEITTNLCASAIRAPFSFNDWMPDKELASRGVLDAALKYPYRDDALKLWEALNEWVGAYVRAYYKSDKDVVEDYELANWCREIVDPDAGGIPGFGETPAGEIKTVDYLVRFVSMVVFTASVQHAAVNFTQGAFMQFVPAMPMVGFSPPPKTAKPFKDIDHWVEEMLPDLKVAKKQLNTAELLAAFQYTTLGEYGRDLAYAPDEVDDALKAFQVKLGTIGAEIQKRNAVERLAGMPIYDFLVPKNIPQSTNV